MIDINKKYRTRDGRPVRILAVRLIGAYPVAAAITEKMQGESLAIFTENGRFINDSSDNNSDLIEVGPYDDFTIGEPVMAGLFDLDKCLLMRYFAGVTKDGRPMVFDDGLTQWTANGLRTICAIVRRPTYEEMSGGDA